MLDLLLIAFVALGWKTAESSRIGYLSFIE